MEYDFSRIVVTFHDEKVEIDRTKIDQNKYANFQSSLFNDFPPALVERALSTPGFRELMHGDFNRADIIRIASRSSLPTSVLEGLLFSMTNTKRGQRSTKYMRDVEARLERNAPPVLYLPTYRRIEQDLKSLFPDFEGDWRKAVRNRVVHNGRAGFVELVEFGMEDVVARVDAKLAALKEESRIELNNLAGSYLRDVIRGEAREWSEEKINLLEDKEVAIILGRVEENQLYEGDKGKVFEVIHRIRNRLPLNNDQDLLAHFFSKLVNIHEAQKAAAVPLRQFFDVCNKYLQSKHFDFDADGYLHNLRLDGGGEIEMRDLSSGEKQIVSLFAQLYLGDAKIYGVIIDEPELSLSVEWQQTLLPDIIKSGRCSFLAAVTHSPFIYENDLFKYARDLAELQEVSKR
ncbi:AAA family ATPase [Achromobacter xylosoxidans]